MELCRCEHLKRVHVRNEQKNLFVQKVIHGCSFLKFFDLDLNSRNIQVKIVFTRLIKTSSGILVKKLEKSRIS